MENGFAIVNTLQQIKEKVLEGVVGENLDHTLTTMRTEFLESKPSLMQKANWSDQLSQLVVALFPNHKKFAKSAFKLDTPDKLKLFINSSLTSDDLAYLES